MLTESGHLAENIAYFGRALRVARLRVRSGAVLDAVAAVEVIGLGRKQEDAPEKQQLDLDSRLTISDVEMFRSRDFEQMSAADIAVKCRANAEKMPPLVAICDISGSMRHYSGIFLHFLHHLAQTGRRVLGQGAIVLLITDGLERDLGVDLPRELARLHRFSRRLIWLNPLLRYAGFEAKAAGIRVMLNHVDEFRSLHNLTSVADLCAALGAADSAKADLKRYLREA